MGARAAGLAAGVHVFARTHWQVLRAEFPERGPGARGRWRGAFGGGAAADFPATAHTGVALCRAGGTALRPRSHRDAGQRRGHHAGVRLVVVDDGARHESAGEEGHALRHRAGGDQRFREAPAQRQDWTGCILRRSLPRQPADVEPRVVAAKFAAPAHRDHPRTGHRHRRRHRHRREAHEGAQGREEPHHHPAHRW